MTTAEADLHHTLHEGTAAQVSVLRCPVSGGPLRIEYCETKRGSHLRVTGIHSDFIIRASGVVSRPAWIAVLGEDFVTTPPGA